jgi:hypothetical protein
MDPRFRDSGLSLEIFRLLSERAASFEDVSVSNVPVAPAEAYLGRSPTRPAGSSAGGEE